MGDLLGVVLCGGESRRMGRDKGLLTIGDRPWALCMGDKLQAFHLPVVYSINERQFTAYSAIIAAEDLVADGSGWAGPLNGLLSIHRRFPQHDLLLVACDMPDLDAGTIEGLIAAYETGQAELYAYEDGGFLQPFCAIYTHAALDKALDGPPDGSLQRLLREGRTMRLPVADSGAFRNYNERADL